MFTLALSALLAVQQVLACGNHSHVRRMQPGATPSAMWPTAPLEWGNFNVLHTTDTHGWLMGHLKASPPEPNYSGDLGDFASFVSRMKRIAEDKKVDLLLVDSGDLHDGNGLSDGYPVGEVDGQSSNQFLLDLPYDMMAIGNHELYSYSVAYDMHKNFAPRLNGRYLTSNVNITILDDKSNKVTIPLGNRFVKFETQHKRKVTAFGVMFHFTHNSANTTVQKPEDMVNEAWFKDAIAEEPDVFLLVGHMPVQNDKWPVVHDAIRAVHPNAPILIFGGHSHIRDCEQYDQRSMALQSGRYMETIGWMSAKLDAAKNTKGPIEFSRRYLDANRNTYKYHTSTGDETFDTSGGMSITSRMHDLAEKWKLTEVWGTAPQDYYLNRVQYPNNSSLVSLLAEQVMPKALESTDPARAAQPHITIIGTSFQRFDIHAGPFTRNDQYIVSPFVNAVQYLPGVPAHIAIQITDRLNNKAHKRSQMEEQEEYERGEVGHRYDKWVEDQYAHHRLAERDAQHTLGYVTKDSCPGVGDDIRHEPTPYYPTPKYVSVPLPPSVTHETPVDVVFSSFFDSKVLSAVNSLSKDKTYSKNDILPWGGNKPLMTNAIYESFAKDVWGSKAKPNGAFDLRQQTGTRLTIAIFITAAFHLIRAIMCM